MSKQRLSDNKSKSQQSPDQPALKEFFHNAIKDLFWAENHLVKSLPKMASASSSPELKEAILAHLSETKEHVKRLEQIFSLIEETPIARKCDAMEGLTIKGESMIEQTLKGTLSRDVGIILASQNVEHFEISCYTGLQHLATTLGLTQVASLLGETLEEEKKADEKLSAFLNVHLH